MIFPVGVDFNGKYAALVTSAFNFITAATAPATIQLIVSADIDLFFDSAATIATLVWLSTSKYLATPWS